MKKYTLVLAAGLLFAACNNSNPSDAAKAQIQAQIDSIASAKAAMEQSKMSASNDSMINAVAKAKADSMEMAKQTKEMSEKKEGHGAEHKKVHETKKSEQPAKPETIGNGKPSMNGNPTNTNGNKNNNSNTIGNGKPKM